LPIAIKGVLAPDVALVDISAPVRMTHRRIDGHDVYFLSEGEQVRFQVLPPKLA
jgi:hypothetical protein